MFCIVVGDGRILALSFQYGVRLGVVDVAVGSFKYPFEHFATAIGSSCPPTCQFTVAVKQEAVELETL